MRIIAFDNKKYSRNKIQLVDIRYKETRVKQAIKVYHSRSTVLSALSYALDTQQCMHLCYTACR